MLLAFRIDLLLQRMLDSAPLLKITLLKLRPFIAFQTQTGIAQCRINFSLDLRAIDLFTLPHDSLFFRAHFHPAFGIATESLSLVRGHRHPPVAKLGVVMWLRNGPLPGPIAAMRLRCGQPGTKEDNRERDCAYKVCVSSSHRLFSSAAINSSRSAMTS